MAKAKRNYRQSRPRLKIGSQKKLFPIQVIHLFKWIIRTYGLDPSLLKPTKEYMAFIEHIHQTKGLKTTIEIIKLHRLCVTRALSGSPLYLKGVTYDGYPKKLCSLIPLIRRGEPKDLRYVMTILTSLRRITLPVNPEIETITSPSTGQHWE